MSDVLESQYHKMKILVQIPGTVWFFFQNNDSFQREEYRGAQEQPVTKYSKFYTWINWTCFLPHFSMFKDVATSELESQVE